MEHASLIPGPSQIASSVPLSLSSHLLVTRPDNKFNYTYYLYYIGLGIMQEFRSNTVFGVVYVFSAWKR